MHNIRKGLSAQKEEHTGKRTKNEITEKNDTNPWKAFYLKQLEDQIALNKTK
jgi:hypothetical protein